MKTNDELVQLFDDSVCSESMVVIGLGNLDRTDDGVGLVLVSKLQACFPDCAFLETEHTLEMLVLELLDREDVRTILFIDAAHFGGKPGDVRFFHAEDVERFIPMLSTHKVPISLLMHLIRDRGKNPVLLGVEPKSVALFGSISPEIRDTINRLEMVIKDCLLKDLSKNE